MRRRRFLILAGSVPTAVAGCQTREDLSEPSVVRSTPSDVETGPRPDAIQWDVYRIGLSLTDAYADSNKYSRITVTGRFTGPDGQTVTVPGFWDGGETFAIRFAPPAEGIWTYEVTASVDSFSQYTGILNVITVPGSTSDNTESEG